MELALPSRLVRFSELVLPELRAVPPADRAAALRRAVTTTFDAVELIAFAIGVVLVTWLTRNGVESLGPLERVAQTIAGGAIALPLMVLLVAAILWRRTRRGLREAGESGRHIGPGS